MTKYNILFQAYYPHTLSIFSTILAQPIVEKLAFPSEMLTGPEDSIMLSTLEDFDTSLLSPCCLNDESAFLHLEGVSGIKFNLRIPTEFPTTGRFFRSSFGLEFTRDHVQSMSLSLFEALFTQVVPVFRAVHASMFDSGMRQYRAQKRYFVGPDNHSYPIEIGWMTYFSTELIEHIGRERFLRLPTHLDTGNLIDLSGGLMVISHEEPFFAEDETHRQHEADLLGELDLERFQRRPYKPAR